MSPGPIYALDRRDASEPEVIAAFRAAGATIVQHSGADEPDLFVGWLGEWHAVEVKTGKGKLRPGQEAWSRASKGEPLQIARTAQDAMDLLRQWRVAQAVEKRRAGQAGALPSENESHGGGVDAAIEENERGCACDACHVSPKEGPA